MANPTEDHNAGEPLQTVTPCEEGRKEPREIEAQPTSQDEDLTSLPHSAFSPWQKRMIALGAASMGILSPLGSQIYLPALPAVAAAMDVSITKINLTVTSYMIVQAIAPMLVGSLADSGGRRPAYFLCLVTFLAACIGLALAPNYGAVVALRCIQSAGASPTIALSGAVVADIATSGERGTYIAYTVLPAVLGPTLGPVVGGFLASEIGWRFIFWFLTILSVLALLIFALFFPETCRAVVENGSVPPPKPYRTLPQIMNRGKHETEPRRSALPSDPTSISTTHFRLKPPDVVGSLKMLVEKETGTLLVTAGLTYSGFYATATAMPSQLSERYGLNEWQVGLMFLPLAIGSIAAASVVGPAMNWNYRRQCARLGLPFDRTKQQDLSNFPIETVRLQIGIPMMALGGASLVAWGWAMQAGAHLAVLAVLACFKCMGMIGFNNSIAVLLVDIQPAKPGTAAAANNLTKCALGAVSTAAIEPMMNAMGVGWSFSVLGVAYLVSAPMLVFVMKKGVSWRAQLRTNKVG